MKPGFLLLTLLNLFFLTPASAQRRANAKPAFVLVILYNYRDKIRYFEQQGKADMASQLREESALVVQLTRRDFARNFQYCPVYFVADTNVAKAYEHRYEGILTDAEGRPVTALPDATDSSHLVLYYNLYAAGPEDAESTRALNGPYLNVLSHRGLRFRSPRLSTIRSRTRNYSLGRKVGPADDPGFRSRRFLFVQYLPVADKLQDRMEGYFGK